METLFLLGAVGVLAFVAFKAFEIAARDKEEREEERKRQEEQHLQEIAQQQRREREAEKQRRAAERREREAERKFEQQQHKRERHNTETCKRLALEAFERTEVKRFTVEQGRGSNHGGVEISLEWKGPMQVTIEVAKSENPIRRDFQEIINLPVVGVATGGDTLVVQDREVQTNKNYHYYSWWKYETAYEGYARDEDGVYAMEKSVLPFMWRVEDTLVIRSVGITNRERPIEFKKRRRDELEEELETQKVKVRLRGNKPKKVPSLEAVIAEELANQKSQDLIYNRLMEVVEEQGMDEATREEFIQNVVSRLGLDE